MLVGKLQDQEEVIMKKQGQVAEMELVERRMKELRSLLFNNE